LPFHHDAKVSARFSSSTVAKTGIPARSLIFQAWITRCWDGHPTVGRGYEEAPMSDQFGPADYFAALYDRMLAIGLPASEVDYLRDKITDMTTDGPGGWAHEWRALASEFLADDRHDLAKSAYGYAMFPDMYRWDPEKGAFVWP
jgi:hypothetical protein